MTALLGLLQILQRFNDVVLKVGRWLATGAIAIMVLAILAQVFFRYVLNNAQPWPEELARFLMLWMTGLMAPSAFRVGGFVAIDTLTHTLPRRLSDVLTLLLLLVSLLVFWVGLKLGYKHVFSGCMFKSSTLWLPFTWKFSMPIPLTDLDLTVCTRGSNVYSFEWGWTKMPLALSFLSLLVGCFLLSLVNIELLLRQIAAVFGAGDRLRPIGHADLAVE